MRELRSAARNAAKNPAYSSLIIAILAIGIGANTAIFGVANAAFFRRLPFPRADRLAFLWQNNRRTPRRLLFSRAPRDGHRPHVALRYE